MLSLRDLTHSGVYQGREGILQTVIMKPETSTYAVSEAGITDSPYVPATTGNGLEGDSCVDRKPYCALSAARNECTQNPGWMIVNCARSCGMCELLDPARRCDRERLNIRCDVMYSGSLLLIIPLFSRLVDTGDEEL